MKSFANCAPRTESSLGSFVTSDVLRVALLNKYGGTYLDSDAVSIRALPDAPNFIVIERSDSIANGLLRFQPGHPVILKVMRKLGKLIKSQSES